MAISRYLHLSGFRRPTLSVAREVSKVTLPYLLPPDGFSSSSTLYTPWQSTAARCCLHLASKLSLVLDPPGIPYYRLKVSPKAARGHPPEELEALDEALSAVEQDLMSDMERRGERVETNQAILHLIIAGNCLLQEGEDKTNLYGLDQYVVRRSGSGRILELIIEEEADITSLPNEMFQNDHSSLDRPDSADGSPHKLYTWVQWDHHEDKYTEHQEYRGDLVPGSEFEYARDDLPYLALVWTRQHGRDYGRSYGEQYLGDIKAAERLSMSLIRLALHASRVVPLVRPGGVTNIEDIASSVDGQPVSGDKEDVSFLTLDKTADMQVTNIILERIETRLAQAFLLYSSTQRDAERVTAMEIRASMAEIDAGIGGTLSVMGAGLQRPKVLMGLKRLQKTGRLKKFNLDLVDISVTTGIDALGRSQELAKLDEFATAVTKMLGPQAFDKHINTAGYLTKRLAATGLGRSNFLRTQEEIDARDQQSQQMSMAQQAIGPGINAAAKMGQAQMEPQ